LQGRGIRLRDGITLDALDGIGVPKIASGGWTPAIELRLNCGLDWHGPGQTGKSSQYSHRVCQMALIEGMYYDSKSTGEDNNMLGDEES
jgi:hypothetical protein